MGRPTGSEKVFDSQSLVLLSVMSIRICIHEDNGKDWDFAVMQIWSSTESCFQQRVVVAVSQKSEESYSMISVLLNL